MLDICDVTSGPKTVETEKFAVTSWNCAHSGNTATEENFDNRLARRRYL